MNLSIAAVLQVADLRSERAVSEAPAPVKNVSTRSKVGYFISTSIEQPLMYVPPLQIKQDGMTDSQREQAQLDTLFDASQTFLPVSHLNPRATLTSPNDSEC